jgi:hypothetical protein
MKIKIAINLDIYLVLSLLAMSPKVGIPTVVEFLFHVDPS